MLQKMSLIVFLCYDKKVTNMHMILIYAHILLYCCYIYTVYMHVFILIILEQLFNTATRLRSCSPRFRQLMFFFLMFLFTT